VFGATLYKQHLGFSTDTEDTKSLGYSQRYNELKMDRNYSTVIAKNQASLHE